MGKKKGKSKDWQYYLGSGKIGDLQDRYGVEGVHMGHPDGRSGKPNRSRKDVDKDIAAAMMNDYDTRRSFEAAALDGNKDAKKFAKKGFKGKNIYDAWDAYKGLKKEYVGGGGMRGAKNEAGLTQAIVEADRKNLLSKIGSSGKKTEDEVKENTDPNKYFHSKYLSPHLQGVNDRLAQEYPTPLYDETERASSSFASDYLSDVSSGLNLNEDTGLNLSNAYAYLQRDRDEEDERRRPSFM